MTWFRCSHCNGFLIILLINSKSLSTKIVDHAKNAKAFINDEERTDWHNAAVTWLRVKRDGAVNQIPEWEQLRDLASRIKDHVLANLDDYLMAFEKNATNNGVHVHWAQNADEHNKIVLGILRKHGACKMVKSKSMLTEECHLNKYLEQNGIQVVDTDLGERIIQFRREPPSHIIAPAIHIRKEEVGELFCKELDTRAGASDPTYLTEAARHHLRSKYLEADVALTGVNFAVAETGGIVVCTNEGNADMGVHMVPVQIHSMGLEKIIPEVKHLGVFTRLLARSATGQPLTIYTSHHHRPKAGGEMHVILLDNGRSDHLGRKNFRSALKCIRCGACMNTCPVYRRSGGYSYEHTVPGPIGSILTPGKDLKKFNNLPFASSLCGACTDVCPVKINIHEQLYLWRQIITEKQLISPLKKRSLRIMGKILSSPSKYQRIGKWTRKFLRVTPSAIMKNPLNVWGQNRELPPSPKESFKEWYQRTRG